MSVDQNQFRQAMLNAEAPVPQGLSDGEGQPAGRRFSVYRNNVAVSLTEALETGFPVIAKLLGEQNFKAIAGVFLRQHPPSVPVMMYYGAEFPKFLASFEPLQHLGYLADVAQIELALRRSYHAADSSAIAPDALAQIAPEHLPEVTMTLAPSVEVLTSDWPIYDIWAYNTYPDQPKPQARAQDVLVVRPEFDPAPHPLPPGGAQFLRAIAKGDTLGAAAERAADTTQDFDLSAVLGLLLGHGALTSITHEDTE